MKKYMVTFYYKGKPICNTWKTAESADMAEFSAYCALLCHAPNMAYNEIRTEEVFSYE